jgi:hypothetical protein
VDAEQTKLGKSGVSAVNSCTGVSPPTTGFLHGGVWQVHSASLQAEGLFPHSQMRVEVQSANDSGLVFPNPFLT